jgi:hypothetical protein
MSVLLGTSGEEHCSFKVKLSHYTSRRRLGGEDVERLLILDLGTRWG